jgi:hypothetical protein
MRAYISGLTVLLAATGQVSIAQTLPPGPPPSVTSSWRISRDSQGRETRRDLINRTYAFGFRYIRTKPTDLLFIQEIRTTERASQEGDNGHVHLEAWANARPDTGYRRRLWVADLPGAQARLTPDYFETTESGCCGTFDTRTLVSLETGRPVASLTSGPVSVRGGLIGEPRSQRPISVVYLSSMGTRPLGRGRTDSLAFGELTLLEGDSVLSRVVLRATRRELDPLASVEFAFRSGRDSVSEGSVFIQPGAQAAAYIYSDAWKPVIIPLLGRAFTLSGATQPAGVKAEMIKPR